MKKLNTFQVFHNGKELTPELVTARNFGRWFKEVFTEQVCRKWLYVSSSKKGSEYHPGTKIGIYFDSNTFSSSKYNSWYIPKNSEAFAYLHKRHHAKFEDVSKRKKNKALVEYLRCFTIPQIELFVSQITKELGIKEFSISTKLRRVNTVYKDSVSYTEPNKVKNPLF